MATNNNEIFWVIDEHRRQKNLKKDEYGIISSALVDKALKIAFDAHKDQTDKSGRPYILHPLQVAAHMKGDYAVCAALLHDVVEDSNITFKMLSDEGFPDEIISVLKLLTHEPSVTYMDYILNIKKSNNSLAVAVKLADLKHNSDLSRLESVDEQAAQRYFKYMEAIALLDNDNWKFEGMQYIYNTLKTRVLDIKSYAPSIGGRISNLTKRIFIFDGVECGSIEGVLQSFKFPDPVRQEEICAMFGFSAKKAGKNQDWKTKG